MTKCFIVENLDSETPKGVFTRMSYYVAKITNNQPNTLAILDENQNWIPFKWYTTTSELGVDHCRMYFYVLDNFLIENKIELNNYICKTNLYN
jgi:hypothetical protein